MKFSLWSRINDFPVSRYRNIINIILKGTNFQKLAYGHHNLHILNLKRSDQSSLKSVFIPFISKVLDNTESENNADILAALPLSFVRSCSRYRGIMIT